MNILTALTYYRPHYSGLTIYAERLACALGRRGHAVKVVTSRYDRGLLPQEQQDGVTILRQDVLMRRLAVAVLEQPGGADEHLPTAQHGQARTARAALP